VTARVTADLRDFTVLARAGVGGAYLADLARPMSRVPVRELA
jgi:hypothetical protein